MRSVRYRDANEVCTARMYVCLYAQITNLSTRFPILPAPQGLSLSLSFRFLTIKPALRDLFVTIHSHVTRTQPYSGANPNPNPIQSQTPHIHYPLALQTSLISPPPSQLRPEPPKHPRNRPHPHRHQRQQRRRPPHPQPAIHGQREQRKHGRQRVAGEHVGAAGAGAEERAVRVHHVEVGGGVDEEGREDDEGLEDDGEDGGVGVGGEPGEEEEGEGEGEGGREGGVEAVFGGELGGG